ncbi:MAG: hypothetical protein B6241_13590 [Spirochaetaceae bacterium 4572_59]|nr:MAG: hypothetical protein B6241_13590 [Spirochaetaceae bacterium 4572_59]
MRNTSKITGALLLLIFASTLSAAAPKVIATTGWTASFAQLAGVENLEVLAPYEMKHPPEYELSLSELQKVAKADYIVFAGYEAMMTRIKEALGSDSSVQLIQIKTINSYPLISESVMKIAAALGTEDKALSNLKELKVFISDWKAELAGQDKLNNVVVHFHQQGPVKGLGLKPALVFGPSAPTLIQIRDILKIKPQIIIDNLHNPAAASFKELMPRPDIVQWINFPGTDGTVSLLDVMNYNRQQLAKVLK